MQRYRSGHNGADSKSVWEQSHEGSNPSRCASSSQATYRLRRAFSFHYKAHRALILLLLASKPDPLSQGSGLGPPLRGAFVLSRGDIDFNRPFQKERHDQQVMSFFLGSAGQKPAPPSGDFKCSGEMNSPCAKVFAKGENACTAQKRRRPEGRIF